MQSSVVGGLFCEPPFSGFTNRRLGTMRHRLFLYWGCICGRFNITPGVNSTDLLLIVRPIISVTLRPQSICNERAGRPMGVVDCVTGKKTGLNKKAEVPSGLAGCKLETVVYCFGRFVLQLNVYNLLSVKLVNISLIWRITHANIKNPCGD